jgi:integrase/recombinase XerD
MIRKSGMAFLRKRKSLGSKGFLASTLLAILFREPGRSQEPKRHVLQHPSARMSLHASTGSRKYLNAFERRRFRGALRLAPESVRLFCLTLIWSGGRISEVLGLTPQAIDLDAGVVSLKTLKRRARGFVRQVPLPPMLLRELERAYGLRTVQRDPACASLRLWPWGRTTAWRYVKTTMTAADIVGPAASPKGLRHSFGVAAFQAKVPPHIVQRWLGHASLRTTAIYAEVSGREERAFASRMWRIW